MRLGAHRSGRRDEAGLAEPRQFVDHLVHALTGQVLHNKEVYPPGFADPKDRHNARMVKLCRGGFAGEGLASVWDRACVLPASTSAPRAAQSRLFGSCRCSSPRGRAPGSGGSRHSL